MPRADAHDVATARLPRWSSSRSRASACCCSCGCRSAARSRSSRRATACRSRSPRRRRCGLEADVRIAGVSVGKVRQQDARQERQPHARDDRARPRVRAAARATRSAMLRQKTLLGETYVRAHARPVGARRSPRAGGCRTARSRRRSSSTRSSTRSTRRRAPRSAPGSRSSAQGIKGRGRDFNDALGTLPGFAADGADVCGVLDSQEGAVHAARQEHRRHVRRADRERAAAAQPHHLVQAACSTRPRRSNDDLAETIRIFPTFLDESKATLARLQTFSHGHRSARSRT